MWKSPLRGPASSAVQSHFVEFVMPTSATKKTKKSQSSTRELVVTRLAPRQQAAMEMLLTGKSVADSARSAGVSRITLHRWLRKDAAFRAAYNQWRDELQESCRSRLEALTDKAADAIEKALETGDARTALQLLKSLGLIQQRPIGPTDPEEIREYQAIEEKRRGLRVRREKAKLMGEEMTADMGI
jgi:AcrR family transcriptional regulator